MNDQTKIAVTGEITAKFYRQENKLAQRWNSLIEKLITLARLSGRQKMAHWLFSTVYLPGVQTNEDFHKNVICNVGFNQVCQALAGDLGAIDIAINKMLLGTGATGSAAATDTQLQTETYRNDTASGANSSNICYVTAFFTQTEVTGTFTEFGNAIRGTGTANSGYLWSHLKGLNWVKDSVTTLTIDCKYTFTSV
jgi:hypothetical protein